MARRYLPLAAAAWMTTAFLLAGAGVAAAAPDSHGDKGGGKPSTAASSNPPGKSGSGPGKPATTPAGNSPGHSPGGNFNPENSPGNSPGNSKTSDSNAAGGGKSGNPAAAAADKSSGPKNLPDTASPVASAATGKPNPGSTEAPNSFGKSVAAAASAQREQAGGSPVAVGSGVTAGVTAGSTAAVTATLGATVTAGGAVTVEGTVTVGGAVALEFSGTTAPSGGTPAKHDGGPTAAVPRTDRTTPVTATPSADVIVQPRTSTPTALPQPTALAAATISASAPQDTPLVPGTERSWLGNTASHLVSELREALREVTLKELALAALPGLAGILFFFATGIGIGHRQARFGFAIAPTGVLRFAAGGPLGVVRPGGFIAVTSRTKKRRGAEPARRAA